MSIESTFIPSDVPIDDAIAEYGAEDIAEQEYGSGGYRFGESSDTHPKNPKMPTSNRRLAKDLGLIDDQKQLSRPHRIQQHSEQPKLRIHGKQTRDPLKYSPREGTSANLNK